MPAASWPEQGLPRGGAIGEFTGVCVLPDSMHQTSKEKRQGSDKLTADSPRALVRAERKRGAWFTAVESVRFRGDLSFGATAARAAMRHVKMQREECGYFLGGLIALGDALRSNPGRIGISLPWPAWTPWRRRKGENRIAASGSQTSAR